jgi:hypothetical protein
MSASLFSFVVAGLVAYLLGRLRPAASAEA